MQSHKLLHSAQLPNAIPITPPAFSQCSFNSRLAVSEPQNATDSPQQKKQQQQQQSLRAYQPELRLSTSNVNRRSYQYNVHAIHLIPYSIAFRISFARLKPVRNLWTKAKAKAR